MLTIEIMTPAGLFDAAARSRVAGRLVDAVMDGPTAPESVLDAGRALTQVLFHEPAGWFVGDGSAPDDPPRCLVRVTVPASWLEAGPVLIGRISAVLAREDSGPGPAAPQPWIHLHGLPDGGIGAFGRALTGTDIVRLMTDPYREGAGPEPAPGVDPVCGMAADPATAPHRLTVDGTAYGFCSAGCRAVFAEDHGLTV